MLQNSRCVMRFVEWEVLFKMVRYETDINIRLCYLQVRSIVGFKHLAYHASQRLCLQMTFHHIKMLLMDKVLHELIENSQALEDTL